MLVKRFNNFFAYKITNNVYLMHNVFSFFNHRNFFKAISNIAFCKNVFIFWYSNNITNFKFTILGNNFFTLIISIYVLYFTSTCLILIVIWYVWMHWFHWSIVKFTGFIYPYFAWFEIRLFENFLKSTSDCSTFIFQRINPCVFTKNINNT